MRWNPLRALSFPSWKQTCMAQRWGALMAPQSEGVPTGSLLFSLDSRWDTSLAWPRLWRGLLGMVAQPVRGGGRWMDLSGHIGLCSCASPAGHACRWQLARDTCASGHPSEWFNHFQLWSPVGPLCGPGQGDPGQWPESPTPSPCRQMSFSCFPRTWTFGSVPLFFHLVGPDALFWLL